MKLIIKLFIGLLSLAFVGIISAFLLYGYYNSEINKPLVISDTNKSFEIEKGSSVSVVGQKLYELGFLSKPEILRIYMYMNKDKTIQAGFYKLSTDEEITLINLVDMFQNGSFDIRLTFIEGWRKEEYRDYLENKISKEFADAFINSKYIKEGYMFPDTYTVDRGYSPDELASFMRNTFNKKVSKELFNDAALRGLSEDQVIILASLLEREMNIKKDRPVVAGILAKRLENDWPLQIDASVQYAMGTKSDWWPSVARSDLKTFESPYNTYLNKGLPPAAISNPGLDAIKSVVYYEESPYWFYITGTDGVTHYAETLEEHNDNVSKYIH